MKVTPNIAQLRALIRDLKPVASRKSALDITSHVLLEADGDRLTISATDLDTSVTGSIECKVERPGSATVPFGLFEALLGKLNTDPTLDTVESDTTLRAGRSKYVLKGLFPANFPKLHPMPTSPGLKLKAPAFLAAIATVGWCTDESKATEFQSTVRLRLTGGLISFTATDGFKLGLWESSDAPSGSFNRLIPARTATEVAKLVKATGAEDVEMFEMGTTVGFKAGDRFYTGRTLDAHYPAVEQIIPTSCAHNVLVPRAELYEAVDRALIVADQLEARMLDIKLEAGTLSIVAGSQAVTEGVETIDVDYHGDTPFEIRLNGLFFRELLRSTGGDDVMFGLNSRLSPVKVTVPDDARPLILLMPLNKPAA